MPARPSRRRAIPARRGGAAPESPVASTDSPPSRFTAVPSRAARRPSRVQSRNVVEKSSGTPEGQLRLHGLQNRWPLILEKNTPRQPWHRFIFPSG